MFEFTTQTVYNSIATTGKDKNMWIASEGKKPALRIGNTRFDKELIEEVQMKLPTPEALAKVTFDLGNVKTIVGADNFAGNYRIALYIGLSMNSLDSFYANDFVYKGKPLYVEFPVLSSDSDGTTVAPRIKKIADKYMLFMAQEKILDVTVDGDTVSFEGVNGYQIIKKAVLQKFNEASCDSCDKEGFEDIITGVPVVYTIDSSTGLVDAGNEGEEQKMDEDGNAVALDSNEVPILPGIEAFGDYNWIIHNLRLPTAANTDFWAPTKNEMPAVGTQYTQFIIRICKDRDGIAGEVVGQRATSVTNHVLYVAGLPTTNGSAAKAVYDALTSLSVTIKTDADTVLNNPYNQSEDEGEDDGQ